MTKDTVCNCPDFTILLLQKKNKEHINKFKTVLSILQIYEINLKTKFSPYWMLNFLKTDLNLSCF